MRKNPLFKSGLLDLCSDLGARTQLVLVEVGVYAGDGTKLFLQSGKFNKIFSIDPWKSGYDDNDEASKSSMQEVEKEFDKVVTLNSTIVTKLKGTLYEYKDLLKQYPIDIVYIDAKHTYDAVKRDISIALELNPRIAIAGHDYEEGWPGVMKAVDECFKSPDKVFSDTSWIHYVR